MLRRRGGGLAAFLTMKDAKIFGYTFKDVSLLDEALTTPSYRMTSPKSNDNQRLEFLGDAVLGVLATDWLYANNPRVKEGVLTGKRQHMVSTAALCEAAAKTDIHSRLKRNKGAGELALNSKTIADAVEAVIGAAWLDGGLEAARTVFDNLSLSDNSVFGELDGNPKSALQHFTQSMKPPRVPVYKLVKISGTSNQPVFTIEACVEGVGSALGVSGNRKDAEAAAAAQLIDIMKQNASLSSFVV